MVKKIFQVITAIWCLYGVVRLCMLLNPVAFRAAKIIKPLWNQADNFHVFMVWLTVFVMMVVAIIFYGAIGLFFNWLFNTYEDEE